MIKGINGWMSDIIKHGYALLYCIGFEFDNEVYYDNELKFDIIKQLLELTQKYELCELLPKEFREQLGIDVIEVHLSQLRHKVENDGVGYPLDRLNGMFPEIRNGGLLFSKMSFYEDDKIVSKSVMTLYNSNHNYVAEYDYLAFDSHNQLGIYYSRTHEIQKHNMVSFNAPLQLHCSDIYKNPLDSKNKKWGFRLRTNTDIWLPVVVRMKKKTWEYEYDYEDLGEVDNLPLAINHTPRLNGLIEDIVKLTKYYGGSIWTEKTHYNNPFTPTDEDVYTEYGIKLP